MIKYECMLILIEERDKFKYDIPDNNILVNISLII